MKKVKKMKRNKKKLFKIIDDSSKFNFSGDLIWLPNILVHFILIRYFLHSQTLLFYILLSKNIVHAPIFVLAVFNQQQSMRNNVNLQIVIFWTILPFKF